MSQSNAMEFASNENRVEIGIMDGGDTCEICVKDWGGGTQPQRRRP